MKPNGDKATIRELYKLVEDTRKELNTSITRLETKFDNLEAGRLSGLETKLANFEGRAYATAGGLAFIVSTAIAIAGFIIKK